MYDVSEIHEMIGEAEVDKRVYLDQSIFDLEMQRVFGGAWVYLGHESQIPEPGDFFTTEIGTQPLIVSRNAAGGIEVFYNRCPHRGAKLVNERSGRVKRFVCNFHAYSFHLDGASAGIPMADSYKYSTQDQCPLEMRMREVDNVDNYRGFIFACLGPVKRTLRRWLNSAMETIDNFVDRSPEGAVEVVGPPYRWINRCNWKILVENVVDGAHVGGTHPSIGQTGAKLAKQYQQNGEAVPPILEMAQSFWQSNQFIRDMGVTVLPNGHSYNGGKVSLHTQYSDIPGYVEALTSAYGKERTNHILSQQRHNTLFYPNMHMKTMIQKIRVFKPLAPDKTLVECWVFRLRGAPDGLLQRTMTYAEMLDSPAALVSTDDAEVMMRMQSGLRADAQTMVSMHRGRGRQESRDGDSLYCEGDSERPFIEQFATWRQLMCQSATK